MMEKIKKHTIGKVAMGFGTVKGMQKCREVVIEAEKLGIKMCQNSTCGVLYLDNADDEENMDRAIDFAVKYCKEKGYGFTLGHTA